MAAEEEEALLRSVALQNANSILLARQRAEAELIRTKDALRESEERLRGMFNQAAVGIAVAALDGHFVEVNRKFSEILGYSREEFRQITFQQITHRDDLAPTQASVKQLLEGEIPEYTTEKRYIRKDGSFIWSHTTVTLLSDAAGRPQQFLGVVEDISARKRTEALLQQQAAENARLYEEAQKSAEERTLLLESERAARTTAERMSELKDEFLATLSHELRTPLNAILGWAQILRGGTGDGADLTRGLETIERNARVQTQLIEDLLDMSRITSGKLRLDIQPISPVSFIEASIDTVTPAANAKGIRLHTLLDPSAGPVSGDPGRLQQVVWNLLSNAIKFTPRDGKVQVLLQRVDSQIEISVADTGVGINRDFLPHLFERFRQGDASTTRKFGGLGLGLSIVKSLVELHGGTVAVTSAGEGLGTTVTVLLPISVVYRRGRSSEAHPRSPGQISAPFSPTTELSGLRILVVDDQPDALDLVRRVLEDCDARVMTADNTRDALRLVEGEQPDVLISDIGMPDMDGFELLRMIRGLGPAKGGSVPAIALTAFARSEDRTRALRAGFLVHVAKPVDPSELVATVASVARRTQAS
ncbi:MAG: ATP-binding protein [Vicinamibacterales bacterium]